ncbi:DUF2238 domain-containing protein [Candidatus Woesearchaeota archaeon]|nr:DUF2238 domain-containing protein [Candidatus Woesearchaeota archaeon]
MKTRIKKDVIYTTEFILILLVLGVASFFGIGIAYPESPVLSCVLISVFWMGFLFVAYQHSLSTFFLTFLTSISTFITLSITLGNGYGGNAPLVLPFVLRLEGVFLLATGVSLLTWYGYRQLKLREKFPLVLFLVFLLQLIILSFNTSYFEDWIIENLLTIPFIIILYFTHRWFRFSHLSYGLFFIFLVLHIIGAHYTYSEVPFGDWLRDTLALDRNHFDRIVHFSFGLLLAYPMREIVKRIGSVKGFWALYVPIEFVLAASAIFEIIEWLITLVFAGDLGIAYLGTQGDLFDAIKDMGLAGLGSVITMVIVLCVLVYYDHHRFWNEWKTSLKIKQKAILGERVISELELKRKK